MSETRLNKSVEKILIELRKHIGDIGALRGSKIYELIERELKEHDELKRLIPLSFEPTLIRAGSTMLLVIRPEEILRPVHILYKGPANVFLVNDIKVGRSDTIPSSHLASRLKAFLLQQIAQFRS